MVRYKAGSRRVVMSNHLAEEFQRLLKERSDAFRAVEVFAASNYPFSEEQKTEFLELEAKASDAALAFDELSTFRELL
jgi:superfamily II helicase